MLSVIGSIAVEYIVEFNFGVFPTGLAENLAQVRNIFIVQDDHTNCLLRLFGFTGIRREFRPKQIEIYE